MRALRSLFAALTLACLAGCGPAPDQDDLESEAALLKKPVVVDPNTANSILFASLSNDVLGFDLLVYIPVADPNGDLHARPIAPPEYLTRAKVGDLIVGPPATKSISQDRMKKLAEMIDPRLVRTPGFSVSAGQIELGQNGTGFARRVIVPLTPLQAPNDLKVYYLVTAHAPLGEAIFDTLATGEVQFSGQVAEKSIPLADMSGRQLFSQDGVTLKLKTAKLMTRPTVNTALRTRSGTIQSLKFALEDELDADLEVTLETSGSFEKEIKANLFSGTHTLPPQIIGGVPIVETVKVSIDARCHLKASGEASMTVGTRAHQHFTLGARYENFKWSNLSGIGEPTFEAHPPTAIASGQGTLTCDVTPRFSLYFYDIAGPYISVTPSATLTMAPKGIAGFFGVSGSISWQVDAALSAELGFETNHALPGMKQMSALTGIEPPHLTLFERHATIASGTIEK